MSWNETLITMVRVLTNDLTSPYTNEDEALEKIIVVAANYVQQEIKPDIIYSFDYITPNIIPDPVDNGDIIYSNFVVLKAACLADTNLFRTKVAMDGVEAKAGLASLKISGMSQGFKDILLLGPCKAYDSLKQEYQFGDSSIVHGIFSPFISDTFDPMYLSGGDHR